MTHKAIYPGTFDPITLGHIDIVSRAAAIFDHVLLAITDNQCKSPMFIINERIQLAQTVTKHLENVKVVGFSELIANFAQKNGVNILIRGIRSVLDFEYESQFAEVNRYFVPDLETVFLLPSQGLSFISSSLIKDIALYDGNTSSFLPQIVSEAMLKKLNKI
ncbi:Phosphopantetheine adenylyltransferase [Candidatus Hartigia pinicola]|nr:Phosphopantetheine adenylyltransferase [Candidatus Hartigia pinicola]